MTTREARRRAELEARRAKRRPKQRPPRRRAIVIGLVALALAVAAVVLVRNSIGDGEPGPQKLANLGRGGSVAVPDAPAVEIERTPAAFRVVYRLEERGPKVVYSTDKVWVRRPFESRLETWSGRPPGEKKVSSQIARFALRRNEGSAQAKPLVLGLPPGTPASDVRLAPVLADGLGHGLIERREVRRVLDRNCQVYRSGDLLSGSTITAPTGEDYSDSCVDAAGIVLEELLVAGGTTISRRIATEVEEDPVLDDALFVTGKRTVDVRDGGGLIRRMGEALPPGEFFLVPAEAVPAGFERLGRFSVIPSQPANFSDPTREGQREASFADVFVRGHEFFVVDQGGTLRGADPFTVDPKSPTVDLGSLGPGELRMSGAGPEVRVRLDGGRFIRLRGTLPAAELAAIGRALTKTEGAGPVDLLEEPGS